MSPHLSDTPIAPLGIHRQRPSLWLPAGANDLQGARAVGPNAFYSDCYRPKTPLVKATWGQVQRRVTFGRNEPFHAISAMRLSQDVLSQVFGWIAWKLADEKITPCPASSASNQWVWWHNCNPRHSEQASEGLHLPSLHLLLYLQIHHAN